MSLYKFFNRFIPGWALLFLLGVSDPVHAQTMGQVVAWGSNILNQTNLPPDLTNVVSIAAGSVHNLALRSNGTVAAWGGGIQGETNVPPGLSNVVAIAAAGFYGNNYGYSLALKEDGTVVGWGAVTLPQLSNVVAIATGSYWWMALHEDGTVESNYPFLVNGLMALNGNPVSNIVAIASGSRHSLALTRDGTVVGWGLNKDGQATGIPSTDLTYTNGLVTLDGTILSNVVAIAAGWRHSVALRSDGTVVAWGSNAQGQTDVPPNLNDVVALAPGGNEASTQVIAIKNDGQIVAWGGGAEQMDLPEGLTNVIAASVGSFHSLALIADTPPTIEAPQLSSPEWDPSHFKVTCPTDRGRIYSLEYKNSLTDPDWIPASLILGTGYEQELSESNPPVSNRFYRVRRW